jgi:hypothetical protein
MQVLQKVSRYCEIYEGASETLPPKTLKKEEYKGASHS